MFIQVGEPECALDDAGMALRFRPDWAKAHYRYGEACEYARAHKQLPFVGSSPFIPVRIYSFPNVRRREGS
jgi:hypothetical protein